MTGKMVLAEVGVTTNETAPTRWRDPGGRKVLYKERAIGDVAMLVTRELAQRMSADVKSAGHD
jgi:hypothetical protein